MKVRAWVGLAIALGLVALAATVFTAVRPAMQTSSASTGSIAVPAPAVDEPAPPEPRARRPSSRAAASGAYRASSSTSKA